MALRVVLALGFRATCYAVMLWLALLAEARPAPRLPDLVLEHVPYVPWVDRWNYALWTFAYLPVALLLLREDVSRFCRYTVASGVLALLRGLCILATGLGPVNGADVNAGMDAASRARAFLQLVSPVDVLGANTPHTYLTKDLFFSGHTSTTFLLLLYVWRFQGLRAVMLVGHVLVVASVFLSHLHYTIDVIGAYAITFTVFTLFEGNPRALLAGESSRSADAVTITRTRP